WDPLDYEGTFLDDDASVFQADIEWLFSAKITFGCNPPKNDRFCPDNTVTRGQMAAFLSRALHLPDGPSAGFSDTGESIFADDIDKLAAAGITYGCHDGTRFCPDNPITREQMAAFLVRALGYSTQANDPFTDDDTSQFETDIEKLAAAQVTLGCNPPANTLFCPKQPVTRGQMAAFLHRALG
ncbi:MAG: S-layer homology domain-containing protein, partial [Acidimicrobiia bacterium]|nr:S-layer homology domain-containing protein [Acidimicrobiia bacterium]